MSTLSAIAGSLSRRGHEVVAVLNKEELAWEGIEDAMPASLADMIAEIATHPAHAGRGRRHDPDSSAVLVSNIIRDLGLSSHMRILAMESNPNMAQAAFGAVRSALNTWLDHNYNGWDSHMALGYMRVKTRVYIFICDINEGKALDKAAPKYKALVKAARDSGWFPGRDDDAAEDDG